MEKDFLTRPVSRRTIAKGAAWSVPVLAAASGAPALAASPCQEDGTCKCSPIVIGGTTGACKHPGESQGGKAYHVPLCFVNRGRTGGTVTITGWASNGGKITDWSLERSSFHVSPDGEVCVVAHFNSESSANISLTVSYTVALDDGTTAAVDQVVEIPAFRPCTKGTP